MALAALRRDSIYRAVQQSYALLSTISSSSSFFSSQHRYELHGRGLDCNVLGSVEAKYTRFCFPFTFGNGGCRSMSGIRSRVEKRMRRETGRTLREIRRAKKLRKKLMTEEERLIFGLRRALFKARFEQALESQKINIKKIEQELRRRGVNPEDPVAMASVEKVASTFFRAIDEKQGTPYMFRGDKKQSDEIELQETQPPAEDSDQEELDRFIAEIEDAADEEWAAEEAAEKREMDQIRYWSRPVGSDDIPEKDMDSDMDSEEDVGSNRGWRNTDDRNRRGQRDNYDRSRSGNQVTLEGSRRIKDVVGDLDSDDEGTENGTTSSENEDWDIEDKVTDKIRGHRSDIDFGFDGDKERENASSRTKERMRNVQSNVMNRTASGKGRTRELENMDEDWMDEDWDSDDEVINEGRKEHKSSDDNQYTTDNLTDKRRGCKSDMYDHWSSDEDDEYNTKDGLMYMHEKNDTDGEDVARGRSKEIGGANGRDSKHKVVEINKRKKKLDENWDSD
ncbi:CRM-domain containing factor CFM9, mitochondrial isoform X3 [Cryptomeria japonica]|uniref:CRM-domain containing factor CFM9, mitochondrial isoform X3 n=1 Tax=Cryptomeria japonica TaxID=3369 RepID=UPI0027DA4770|nr:CRM-domain containing factor CFM9, mitochondrial isoform X3 [Cryptomeria japonica]